MLTVNVLSFVHKMSKACCDDGINLSFICFKQSLGAVHALKLSPQHAFDIVWKNLNGNVFKLKHLDKFHKRIICKMNPVELFPLNSCKAFTWDIFLNMLMNNVGGANCCLWIRTVKSYIFIVFKSTKNTWYWFDILHKNLFQWR